MAAKDDVTWPPHGRHRQAGGEAEPAQAAVLASALPGQPAWASESAWPDLSQQANGQQADGLPAMSGKPSTLQAWRPEPGRRPDLPAGSGAGPDARPASGLERLLSVRVWPVAAILAVQAALSLRLVWSATAYIDEGDYLTIGHLELAHFLHHAAMPDVASNLSGSPVVYPPLAAIADNIGGLAAARLLSLAFMLIATVALHGVTRRLLASRTAAFFAVALFGWLGTAQFLGAFATYDAMALMLLALATWLGVRAIEADSALRYTLICAGGLSMAVADAAKYASALFDPVVIAVVALAAWRAGGRKAGLDAAGAMLITAALPLTVGFDASGSNLGKGITSTTLTRAAGTSSVRAVLALSVHTTGIIAVLAVLGAVVITARRPGWLTVALTWVLAAAVFLAPAEQARIHTLTSLFKHVGYGAWFACVIAGYLLAEFPALLAWLSRFGPGRTPAGSRPQSRWAPLAGTAAGTAVVLLAGAFGVTVASAQYSTWPDSRPMIADLARLAQPSGVYLIEDPNVVTYYLRSKIPYGHIDNTYAFYYPDPQTGRMLVNAPAYAEAIKRGYLAGIVLAFGDTFAVDQTIVADINGDHSYRLADVIPYRDSYGPSQYMVWLRVPHRRGVPHARVRHRHGRRHPRNIPGHPAA